MHRIDLRAEFPEAELDPFWLDTNRRRATEALSAVPGRFGTAEITDPVVIRWVRAIAAQATAEARAYNPRVQHGPSLLLRGGTGTGKTHHLYGAVRTLWLSGVDCRYVARTAADLLADLRPRPGGSTEPVFARFVAVPLLCLDDLGAHQVTEWTTETLYRLINARYEAGRPMIITTNLSTGRRGPGLGQPVETLADAVGDRVVSRLVEMAGAWQTALKGADRRRAPQPAN